MSARIHPRSVELGLPLLLSRALSFYPLGVCLLAAGWHGRSRRFWKWIGGNAYATYSMASFFMLESIYIGCSYRDLSYSVQLLYLGILIIIKLCLMQIKLEHQKKALGEKSGVRPALRPCFAAVLTGGCLLAGHICRVWLSVVHFSLILFLVSTY